LLAEEKRTVGADSSKLAALQIDRTLSAEEQAFRFPPAAAPSGPALSAGPASPVLRRAKTWRDALSPVIDRAASLAINPKDGAAVWVQLVALAETPEPIAPLVGVADGGVKWMKDTTQGEERIVETMSKRAFMARWRRRAARAG